MKRKNLLMTNAGKGFLEKEKFFLRVFFFQLFFIGKRKNKKDYAEHYQRTACQNYDFHFSPCSFLLKYTPRQNITIKAHQMIMLTNLESSLKNPLANKAARIIFEKSKNVFDKCSFCFHQIYLNLSESKKSVKEVLYDKRKEEKV